MAILERILAALAGLIGASGVALAAAAAHLSSTQSLASAALMALVHAPALLAGLAALRVGLLSKRLGLAGLIGLALGVVLFSGDLAMRAFLSAPLFPMAAPSGGTILIVSWIILAFAGFFGPKTR
jgi:uncharacterized membrane protein YgdD (TMEM256/DUF423 family)